MNFKTQYRVVSDRWNGYEAQFRWWWCPFWFMVGGSNTEPTLKQSIAICRNGKKPKRTTKSGSPVGTVLWTPDEESQ